MTPSIQRLTTPEDLIADTAWWRIYEHSFAAPYRVSRESLLRTVAQPTVAFLRCQLDGQTVGFATLHIVLNPAFAFLGYLAVERKARRFGLGRRLVDECVRVTDADLRNRGAVSHGLLLEAEQPSGQGPSDVARWYAKGGFRALGCAYEQPALNGGEPVPMDLLFRPSGPELLLTPRFELSLVEALYEQVYRASYGIDVAAVEFRKSS